MTLQPDIIAAVEDGATVVASSKRLARVLNAQFAAHQQSRGRSVWNTPSILSWGGFLDRGWREWMFGQEGRCPVLLNPTQELALWEDVIRQSPEGEGLLQTGQTARSAKQAWALLHEYQLPFREGMFAGREDTQAFYGWAAEFARRRDQSGWLEQARLPDLLSGKLAITRVLIAGFDELTPQQRNLLGSIKEMQAVPPTHLDSAAVRMGLHDTSAEIRQAAEWARERVGRDPEVRIGVIVPKLDRLRTAIERIFSYVLLPGVDAATPAFHISLGPALGSAPIVAAALAILETGQGDPSFIQIGSLLRSPFVAGAETERSQRALADAKVRSKGIYRAGLKVWREHVTTCPVFDSILRKLERGKAGAMGYGSWSATFSRMLKSAGWPGERPIASVEHQAIRAWNDALSDLASLDLVSPAVEYDRALDRLREITAATRFQPEDAGAPIQIMGLLEASGLQFDHLWVMGLDDEALPERARPHPFLPLDLQRAHKLPHASPERELEFATKIVQRLAGSAAEVVWSYPTFEGDTPLYPSPLLKHIDGLPGRDSDGADWIAIIQASAIFETFSDPSAPPLAPNEMPSGGTWLIRDMAACPFRAWVSGRARARPLEQPEPGISSRDRGTAIHLALRLIWEELRTQAALIALSTQEMQALVARHLRTALTTVSGIGRALEQRRAGQLLFQWLELERRREPFEVIEFEHENVIELAGMQIKTRIDRVDQLPDGQRIILDYKTGKLTTGCWSSERPEQPQVPLYTINQGGKLAAAAFAQIRTDGLRFRGLADENHKLPEMKPIEPVKGLRFAAQLDRWRQTLERLGSNFREGHAEVDPLKKACDFCGVTPLCRVYEGAAEEPEDE